VNRVTIRNIGLSPIVDEFAKAFAGRAIYSMGDFYLGYNQFQLAIVDSFFSFVFVIFKVND